MRIKKMIARMYLNLIKKGFNTEYELQVMRRAIIKSFENNVITKKDCRILTDICFQYELDNFTEYEI